MMGGEGPAARVCIPCAPFDVRDFVAVAASMCEVCCGAQAAAAAAVQEVGPPAYKLSKSVTWADEEGRGVLTHTLHI
jgi:hypothetical protein